MYHDLALTLLHALSKTLLVCDVVFSVDGTPPQILTEKDEYTRALFSTRENLKKMLSLRTHRKYGKRGGGVSSCFSIVFSRGVGGGEL